MLSSAGPAERQAIIDVLGTRFGVSAEVLSEYRLLRTARVVWAIAEQDGLDDALDAFAVDRTGLPLLRRFSRRWKPTSVALQALGPFLKSAIVDLDATDVEGLLVAGSLRRTIGDISEGYVALRGPQGVLGCGLYLDPVPADGLVDGLIRSLLPKAEWEVMGKHLNEEL